MFAPKYKVHYNKNKSCFSNAKDSYRAGEQVTLIYPFIATDTDYSFSVDGADYKLKKQHDVHGKLRVRVES